MFFKYFKKCRIVLAISIMLISTSYAATYHLNSDGTGDFATIQQAINNCIDGDQIILAEGTYKGEGNRDIDYNGLAITIQSTNPDNHDTVAATIIDCESSPGNEHRGFYFHNQEDINSVISGLTIIRAWGKSAICPPYLNGFVGGAIYCEKSSPLITQCAISQNVAQFGSGIFCYDSNAVIEDCNISNNFGSSNTGTIFSCGASPELINCIISGNRDGSGGVACYYSNSNINNCLIKDHFGGSGSNGIKCTNSDVNIANCTITGNQSSAIRCEDSNPIISNCNIIKNYSQTGGGIYCDNSSPAITDSLFNDNNSVDGGVIYCVDGSNAQISDCDFISNEAVKGGVVFCRLQSSPQFSDCTITDNKSSEGGVVYCYEQSNANLQNCSIMRNTADVGGVILSHNSNPVLNDCLIFANIADYGHGGAIFLDGYSCPVIQKCRIGGNTAAGSGGFLCSIGYSKPIVSDSIITWNNASYEGGAIACDVNSEPNFTNCIIANNTAAGRGGAIFSRRYSKPYFANCTIVNNNANNGGIHCLENSEPNLTNCIIWNDSSNEITLNDSAAIKVQYCNVRNGWVGTGNIETDPCLTADMHLTADSNCIDNGANTSVAYDIDNEIRPDAGINDIGADEFHDADGDGLPNWWELKYFNDPNIALPNENPDNDPYTNIEEYRQSTNPLLKGLERYVDPVDGNDNWDGLAELFDGNHGPKKTIQSAVNDSDEFDTIKLFPGTYKGTGNYAINFAGKNLVLCSIEPNDANITAQTIIDCDRLGRAFSFQNLEDSNSVIDGLTIINGRAINCGAIYCDNSSPVIKNCVIRDCETVGSASTGGTIYYNSSSISLINCHLADNRSYCQYGGAIYCNDSNAVIMNCTLTNNVSQNGGAIYGFASALNIVDCNISFNSAESGYGGGLCFERDSIIGINNCTINNNTAMYGAGICCNDSQENYAVNIELNIINSEITGNAATSEGGGLYCQDSNVVVADTSIFKNSGTRGGGLFFEIPYSPATGNFNLTDCIISENTSTNEGAGIYYRNQNSRMNITECRISQNVSGGNGGGIFAQSSGPIILRSFVLNNSGNYGGGLSINNCSDVEIQSSIISGNTANDGSGGIYFQSAWDVNITNCNIVFNRSINSSFGGISCNSASGEVRNSIIWSNSPEQVSGLCYFYCDIQGGWTDCGMNNIDVDPMLTVDGHLRPGSPCFKSGNPNYLALYDIDGESGHIANIGADRVIDTDADGLPDWYEQKYCGSITALNPADDNDNDGHNNITELQLYNTDPFTAQSVYYVNRLTGTDDNNGLSWNYAKKTILAAVNCCGDGDAIIIAKGQYTEPVHLTGTRDHQIMIKGTDPNDPNTVQSTVLNGLINFGYNKMEGCGVSGITITKTGISCASSPTISRCIIRNCIKPAGGGINCLDYGAPVISDCVIKENQATTDNMGGGIYCGLRSKPVITNCQIIGNSALQGGGIFCEQYSKPVISKSTISFNGPTTSGAGGGIYCMDANLTLTNSVLISNQSGSGSAIYSNGSTLITNCTISRNKNSNVIYCNGSKTKIFRSIIWANYDKISWNNSTPVIRFCNIQNWQEYGIVGNNIDIQPLITPDGHLQSGSPCIDYNFPPDAYYPVDDIDSEIRSAGFAGDIGADEFIDSDSDGLPDWLELKYSGSNIALNSLDDADNDGHNNIAEYELYSSDPCVPCVIYYVNGTSGNDTWDGTRPYNSGGHGPKKTIQNAINLKSLANSDRIVVAQGSYDENLELSGKLIIVQSAEPENPYVVSGTVLQSSYIDFLKFEMNGCTLSGFKIAGLNENHNPINCVKSSPTIANCNIINNRGYSNGAIYCEKSSARIINCNIESNRSNSGAAAIYCNRSDVSILDCVISKNYSIENGIIYCTNNSNLNIKGSNIFWNKNRPAIRTEYSQMLNIEKSIIAGNQSGGIYCNYSNVNIDNAVITKNRNNYNGPDGEAIYSQNSQFLITNTIICDNNSPNSAWDGAIRLTNNSAATVSYSDIQYGQEGIWSDAMHKLIWDIGNIEVDPCFVDPGYWDANSTPTDYGNDYWVNGNYHLKSYGWRWIDSGSNWTWDYSTSRCIDAGNPGCPLGDEAITIPRDPDNDFGINLRINMGAYGGTTEASMAPLDFCLLSDTDNNGRTDINDLNLLTDMWLETGDKLKTDFDHDGNIDFADFALLATEWLEITGWY